MEPNRVVLLLTGTVNPMNMAFTKLQDVEKRMEQYIHSIRFWLKSANIPVVFVENSDTDLSVYFKQEIEERKLEILSFNGNNFPRELGKGYGELLCLEYAVTHSRQIMNADFVFKITGRHQVLNFEHFVKAYLGFPELNLMVDFQKYMTFCDSRMFGFSPGFIHNYLRPYQEIVNDSKGMFFEHILCRASLKAIADGYAFRPMTEFPRINGVSGTFNTPYNSSYLYWLRMKTVYLIKSLLFR